MNRLATLLFILFLAPLAFAEDVAVPLDDLEGLPEDPPVCTPSTHYAKDIDKDGILGCDDPFTGRGPTALTGVNGVLGSSGYIRYHINEAGVEGNVPIYDDSGHLEDSGAGPGGASAVEDHTSACSAGEGFISTGSQADCSGIATQAELDAAALFGPEFQGEAVVVGDGTFGATAVDYTSSVPSWPGINNVFTEYYDALGNWQIRSNGATGSADYLNDNVACWEPPYTHRVWIRDYCGGAVSSATAAPGRPCPSGQTDCEGADPCNTKTWNVATTPDTITITGHGFGASGQVYPHPMGLVIGDSADGPDAGGMASYPSSCSDSVVMVDSDNYWVKSTGTNTVEIYHDDGDLVQQIGTNDKALNCTLPTNSFTALTLYQRNADGTDPVRRFRVATDQTLYILDSDPTTGGSEPWACKMGGSGACTDRWVYNGQCTSGFCMPNEEEVYVAVGLAAGGYEAAIGDTPGTSFIFAGVPYGQLRYHQDYAPFSVTALLDLTPGDCIIGIIDDAGFDNGGLDKLGGGGGSLTITEARRASPVRTKCEFGANGSVGATCMKFGIITNATATGAIELELAAFEAGMDFIVVNQAAGDNNLSVDPNGTERFLSPETDTDGDKLTSDTTGEAIRVYVNTDGEARVQMMKGTWTDGGA
jgi:hypothetical protein